MYGISVCHEKRVIFGCRLCFLKTTSYIKWIPWKLMNEPQIYIIRFRYFHGLAMALTPLHYCFIVYFCLVKLVGLVTFCILVYFCVRTVHWEPYLLHLYHIKLILILDVTQHPFYAFRIKNFWICKFVPPPQHLPAAAAGQHHHLLKLRNT